MKNKLLLAVVLAFGSFGYSTAQSVVLTEILTTGQGVRCQDLQNDGKLIVGGEQINPFSMFLSRINPDGSTDPTFNMIPIPNAFGGFSTVKILADGKILAGGESILVRYFDDGSLDLSFNVTGLNLSGVKDLAITPDNKILVYHQGLSQVTLSRLFPDGNIDFSFGNSGSVNYSIPQGGIYPNQILLQPDGNIIISYFGGQLSAVGGTLKKLTSDGVETGTIGLQLVTALNNMPNGNLLVANNCVVNCTDYNSRHRRYDTTSGITYIENAIVSTMRVDDAKIYCQKYFTAGSINESQPNGNSFSTVKFEQFNLDGTPDINFGTNGVVLLTPLPGHLYGDYPGKISISSDNKIIITGVTANTEATNTKSFLCVIDSGCELNILENELINQTLIYPNPATDKILFSQNIQSASIYSIDGRLISNQIQNNQMDVSALPKGIYLIRGLTGDSKTFTQKLIKN